MRIVVYWWLCLCVLPGLATAQSYNPYDRTPSAPTNAGYNPYAARAKTAPALTVNKGEVITTQSASTTSSSTSTNTATGVGNLFVPGDSTDPWSGFDPDKFKKSVIKDVLNTGVGEKGASFLYYLNDPDIKGNNDRPANIINKIVTELCSGRDGRACQPGGSRELAKFLGGVGVNDLLSSRFSADSISGAWGNFIANLPLSTAAILSKIDTGLTAASQCGQNISSCVSLPESVRNLTPSQLDVVGQFFSGVDSSNNTSGPEILVIPASSSGEVTYQGHTYRVVRDPATGGSTLQFINAVPQ